MPKCGFGEDHANLVPLRPDPGARALGAISWSHVPGRMGAWKTPGCRVALEVAVVASATMSTTWCAPPRPAKSDGRGIPARGFESHPLRRTNPKGIPPMLVRDSASAVDEVGMANTCRSNEFLHKRRGYWYSQMTASPARCRYRKRGRPL